MGPDNRIQFISIFLLDALCENLSLGAIDLKTRAPM